MKLLFGTDFHFDFCEDKVVAFGQYLAKDYPYVDGIIITGDISNGKLLTKQLKEFVLGFRKKVYFVTGNHDIFWTSFAESERKISELNNPLLHYLDFGNVDLGNDTTLVGTSNWYDCRFGNVKNSWIELNDFNFIADFKPNMHNRDQQTDLAQSRASIQAKKFKERLNQVTTNKIVIAAHVPFFEKSSFHMGQISDWSWLPWMTSKVSGEVLMEYHETNPDKQIQIYFGHTHSSGTNKIDDNLICHTGHAIYDIPKESGIINIDDFSFREIP